MKIILQVNGREMTFSEEEVTAIVEEHFNKNAIKQVHEKGQVSKKTTNERYFLVNPLTIDQKLFSQKREDFWQERTRQLILEAFSEMKNNSQYTKPFKTIVPEKTWTKKNIYELEKLAVLLGDHMADWVELALEWAQRIANGETWEAICNNPDASNYFRLVIWKEKFPGHGFIFGGSSKAGVKDRPACFYGICCEDSYTVINHTVPLVVSYK